MGASCLSGLVCPPQSRLLESATVVFAWCLVLGYTSLDFVTGSWDFLPASHWASALSFIYLSPLLYSYIFSSVFSPWSLAAWCTMYVCQGLGEHVCSEEGRSVKHRETACSHMSPGNLHFSWFPVWVIPLMCECVCVCVDCLCAVACLLRHYCCHGEGERAGVCDGSSGGVCIDVSLRKPLAPVRPIPLLGQRHD